MGNVCCTFDFFDKYLIILISCNMSILMQTTLVCQIVLVTPHSMAIFVCVCVCGGGGN